MNRSEAEELLFDERGDWSACRDEWNRRRQDGEEIPELTGLRRPYLQLSGFNLSRLVIRDSLLTEAFLRRTDLSESDLSGSSLSGSEMPEADLSRAKLVGTGFGESTNAEGASFRSSDLTGSQWEQSSAINATFDGANLTDSKFSGVMLAGTTFRGSTLDRARFDYFGPGPTPTSLSGALFAHSSLLDAHFLLSRLDRTLFVACDLARAEFEKAETFETCFASDLSNAKGLASLLHRGPSFITHNAISGLRIQELETLLRGCGLSDRDIALYRGHLGPASDFYSCFISHAKEDEMFAMQLHNDLQDAGVRCWMWQHDARTGEKMWHEIDRAIRVHDKLVLIASENSLTSPEVIREIERALRLESELERRKAREGYSGPTTVLFPLTLDDYVFSRWNHPRKDDVIEHVIADARNWRNGDDAYSNILERLLVDLRRGESAQSKLDRSPGLD